MLHQVCRNVEVLQIIINTKRVGLKSHPFFGAHYHFRDTSLVQLAQINRPTIAIIPTTLPYWPAQWAAPVNQELAAAIPTAPEYCCAVFNTALASGPISAGTNW